MVGRKHDVGPLSGGLRRWRATEDQPAVDALDLGEGEEAEPRPPRRGAHADAMGNAVPGHPHRLDPTQMLTGLAEELLAPEVRDGWSVHLIDATRAGLNDSSTSSPAPGKVLVASGGDGAGTSPGSGGWIALLADPPILPFAESGAGHGGEDAEGHRAPAADAARECLWRSRRPISRLAVPQPSPEEGLGAGADRVPPLAAGSDPRRLPSGLPAAGAGGAPPGRLGGTDLGAVPAGNGGSGWPPRPAG